MRLFIIASLSLVLFSCNHFKRDIYSPGRHLSKKDQIAFKERIIHYVAKAPRRVTGPEKFDPVYDEEYDRQVEGHDLIAYYIDQQKEHYFLIARIAPSIDEKWVATGGRMRYGANGEISEYEEVFRTWKLPREDLEVRGKYLFGLMVRGEDLTPYYTVSAGFNYIEFPDEFVSYDKESRSWKSSRYGSIEEMVYESRDADSLSKKSLED